RLRGLLVIGSNLRREAPVLAHRVRKAARGGAKVAFLNPARFDYLFPVASYVESSAARLVEDLAALVAAAGESGQAMPPHVADAVRRANVTDAHRATIAALRTDEPR